MKQAIREADLVKGIVDGLRYKGRIVFRTGQWRADRAGNDAGLPDLFVWCPQRAGWIALEVKTPTGRIRDAQKNLAEVGASIIVRSIQEAFEAVGEVLERRRENIG